MSSNIADEAERIANETTADVDASEVEAEIQGHMEEFHLPEGEAIRMVNKDYGLEADETSGEPSGNPMLSVGDIDSPDVWMDVEAKVVQLWSSDSDSIAQVGLLGDETGTIKFVSWAKSGLQALEEGESYRLSNVVSDEYEGRFSVNLNSGTDIEELEEDIDDTQTITGSVVSIQQGSGLIERCPEEECSRTLQSGECEDHGAVNGGENDLRTKAVVDDGEAPHPVLLNKEQTSEILGLTVEGAVTLAQEEMDKSVIEDLLADELLGAHLTVEGRMAGEYLLVDKYVSAQLDADDADELLVKARSMEVGV